MPLRELFHASVNYYSLSVNLGVRGATARQAVDVSAMEHNVFAMLVKWLSLLNPLGEPCHVVQRKLGLAL